MRRFGLATVISVAVIGVWAGGSLIGAAISAVSAFIAPVVSLVAGLGPLVLAAVVVAVAWGVRRWRRGRKPADQGAQPLASPLAWQGGATATNSVTISIGGK